MSAAAGNGSDVKINRNSSGPRRTGKLFYETLHSANTADYSPEQLDAWATGSVDEAGWNASFLRHTTRIAEIDGEIATISARAWRGRWWTRWNAR